MEEYISLKSNKKKQQKEEQMEEQNEEQNEELIQTNDVQTSQQKELNRKKKLKQREKEKLKKQQKRQEKQLLEDQQMEQEQIEENLREVFISGLPYESNEQQIENFFKGLNIEKVKLPRFQDSGRLMGYGHVVFKNLKDRDQALGFNRNKLGNRYIEVQIAKGQKVQQKVKQVPPKECKTIFVKNIPYQMTEDELGDLFRFCGEINNVRIAINYSTKQSKGFAYIDFKDHESLQKALEMDGKLIQNRKIIVDFETYSMKQGFRLNVEGSGNQKYNQQVQEIKKKIQKKNVDSKQSIQKIKNLSKI